MSRTVARAVPRILRRNWPLKAAAFALAVVLWALVRADPSRRSDIFSIPVHAEIGDEGWTLAADPDPGTVEVRLRGPISDLIRLAREGTTLEIPLDSVASADTLVPLRRDWVRLARGSASASSPRSPRSFRCA
jgi:hypothetical protein